MSITWLTNGKAKGLAGTKTISYGVLLNDAPKTEIKASFKLKLTDPCLDEIPQI